MKDNYSIFLNRILFYHPSADGQISVNERKAMLEFFEKKRPHNGMTYTDYIFSIEKKIESTNIDSLSDDERGDYNTIKLNLARSYRIQKTFEASEVIKKVVEKIDTPQLWMVLTEDWCGDSAQNLPFIAKIAEINSKIDLRILFRDDNLDIMDLYQTNGTRSIPKLIAFDENGNELFQWGARPAKAQELVNELKSKGISKEEYIEKLHLWYAKDKGNELEKEFIQILKT
ncbi:MAG: thioredoxin family protein [Bacteroidetes bacterium]|nr:thioredoxin family protein [Bacteroidota bacterium]